jgi:hypothetical protein
MDGARIADILNAPAGAVYTVAVVVVLDASGGCALKKPADRARSSAVVIA